MKSLGRTSFHPTYLNRQDNEKATSGGSRLHDYKTAFVKWHVKSSNPVPLKTRRVGQRCTLNLSRAEKSCRWCGVVVRRGGSSSGIFDVKDAPRTGRPVVENVNKTTEIIEIERHISSRSIAQELKLDHKTVLNRLRKVGFKKKLDVWVQRQLTPKYMMNRISICEALAKRNKIYPFLKRTMTGDKKWVTYDNIVRKRSWSKRSKAAQTLAKPELTVRKVLLCIWQDWK
ncbi:histone-lysine N-methyltransferase SETMAR [Trichonephila clavipes]|nr:histone-lysine N-methyltransferase SETMAR [Trichonephila clavipes]